MLLELASNVLIVIVTATVMIAVNNCCSFYQFCVHSFIFSFIYINNLLLLCIYFLFIYLLIIVRDDNDEENAEPTTNLKPEKRRLSSLRSKFIWSSDESNDIFRNLTPLEISMISLINPITSFQIAGAHFQSKTPVYYIVNDIADVATKLPNNINKYDHAILRYIHQIQW